MRKGDPRELKLDDKELKKKKKILPKIDIL